MNNSLISIAYNLVSESEKGLEINELITKTLDQAGLDKSNAETLSNLYIEICTSSKFIYIVDEDGARWDLKTRHSLDEYDKDGYKFVQTADDEKVDDFTAVEEHEEAEEAESEEEVESKEDEENDEEYSDEYSDSDNYSDDDSDDDYFQDSDEDEDFDEDKYNSQMDEYEDKYDY